MPHDKQRVRHQPPADQHLPHQAPSVALVSAPAIEIVTTDYHTAGEPFRIVVGGAPEIPGASVRERREHARGRAQEVDGVRRLLCHEPRGHADMYGCFLVPAG